MSRTFWPRPPTTIDKKKEKGKKKEKEGNSDLTRWRNGYINVTPKHPRIFLPRLLLLLLLLAAVYSTPVSRNDRITRSQACFHKSKSGESSKQPEYRLSITIYNWGRGRGRSVSMTNENIAYRRRFPIGERRKKKKK